MIMAWIMNGVVPQIFKFVENFSGSLFDDPARITQEREPSKISC